MSESLRKWLVTGAALTLLLPVTIRCDVPGLGEVLGAADYQVYYDEYYFDTHHDGCWLDCADDWSFDFDWWW